MSFLTQILRGPLNRYFAGQEPSVIATKTLLFCFLSYYGVRGYRLIRRDGFKKAILKILFGFIKAAPGLKGKIAEENEKVLKKMEKLIIGVSKNNEQEHLILPLDGINRNVLLTTMKKWSEEETKKWKYGQVSGGVYHGGDDLVRFLVEVYGLFALSNPLHPDVFPYIRKMEAEIISMTVNLFRGDKECCGVMTSGGTESILMACKSYRDWGRDRGIQEPEMIIAATAHAAFLKAGDYFGIKVVIVPADQENFLIDLKEVKKQINSNTVLIVGSAPAFPQGVIDPILELSEIAQKHNIGLHVDSCLGGFLLPFLHKIGYKTRPFDFTVPGVTSISADTHKYGFAPKGSSVLLYRTKSLRHNQFFVAPDWTGGIYASPSMQGSRPGGLVAATWAALVSMGENGYLECARAIMSARDTIVQGIGKIKGIRVLGKPDASVVAFASDEKAVDIFKVGEAMGHHGWNLNTLQRPSSVHICCTYLHKDYADKFVSDLEKSVHEARDHPNNFKNGSAAIYGLAESLPDTSVVTDLAKGFLDVVLTAKRMNSENETKTS